MPEESELEKSFREQCHRDRNRQRMTTILDGFVAGVLIAFTLYTLIEILGLFRNDLRF